MKRKTHARPRTPSPQPPNLQTLPTPIIYIPFQPPRNQALHTALKPDLPQQRIVPLLIKEQLVVTTQPGVNLAVLIEVRSDVPRTVVEVEEENHAFADM
jgi:hypothetical protein